MKILITTVAVLGVVAVGSAALYFASNSYPRTIRDPRSESVDDRHEIVAKGIGYVEPVSEVRNLSFKVGGVIGQCHVELGQQVNAGALLMVLDNAEQKVALAVAEEKLELAKAQLAHTLSGVNPLEIRAAQKALELAQERWKHAEVELARRQALLKDKAVSRSEYDAKESFVRQAETDVRRAEAQLQCLQEFVTPEDKLVAEAQVKVASVQRDLAAQGLADTQLNAPFDGTVLEILLRVGEAVTSAGRQPVILFADISRLRIRAEIDERYICALKPGQKVTVTGRALGAKEYQGHISRIKSIMGKKSVFTRSSSEKRDLDIVQVFVDMGDEFRAPAGLRVDVAIRVAQETLDPPTVSMPDARSTSEDSQAAVRTQ